MIRFYGIPSFFVLNMDETGVLLQPGGDITYNETGARDVAITGVEDKRQFTLKCTISMRGDLLPFVALWRGKTKASLPSTSSPDYNICQQQGHRFFFAGEKHWATIETMIQWVLEIVLPFRDRILVDFPQFSKTPMILYLDVYWCHRCDGFLNWLETLTEKFCLFIVIFVPANTTSVNQPCDVGLQRPVKHELKRQYMQSAILETSEQLQRPGITPQNVRLDVSLPHLRNQTPRWLSNTFTTVSGTDAALVSWRRSCRTGIFNLSYETLTSPGVLNYMDTLHERDPTFASVLFNRSATKTIRPVLDGKKVVVEALEPGQSLPIALVNNSGVSNSLYTDYEDGVEVQTGHLVQLMNEQEIEAGFPVGRSEYGAYSYCYPEEDTNFGHGVQSETGYNEVEYTYGPAIID